MELKKYKSFDFLFVNIYPKYYPKKYVIVKSWSV